MRMLLKSRAVLETLTPDDRVAILSFDFHLRIWSDFTDDRERLDPILAHDMLLEQPPAVLASPWPSLIDRLDPDSGRRTHGIERALELIGQALQPLPGSKSLVLIGYGFGRLGPSGVAMENNYGAARQALVESRTSVFSLDVTDADYHSLEAGLQLVSGQTGGFYAKTNVFPDLALRQLAGALAGHYVLFVERPESRRTVHDIKTELTRRKGNVLAGRTSHLSSNIHVTRGREGVHDPSSQTIGVTMPMMNAATAVNAITPRRSCAKGENNTEGLQAAGGVS